MNAHRVPAESVATAQRGPNRLRQQLSRRLAVMLLAAVVLTGATMVPAGRAGALNPPQTDAYYAVALLGYTNQSASIASYWTQTFRSWNRPYAAPRILFYGDHYGNFSTQCGATAQNRNNGFYCSFDNTVYLDYEYMQDFMGPGGRYNLGDYAVGGFLAHEFGHGVQAWLGWSLATFRAEYAADCLAGIYTRFGYAAGRLTGGDYWEFHNWLLTTPWSVTHGDPVMRTRWYRYGYDTGSMTACAAAYQATA